MWNKEQILDAPRGQFVLQEIKIWCPVVANGVHHGFISAIGNGTTNGGFLAFELVPETAFGTGEIDNLGIVLQPVQLG